MKDIRQLIKTIKILKKRNKNIRMHRMQYINKNVHIPMNFYYYAI